MNTQQNIRPKSLSSFIGQTNIVRQIQISVLASLKRNGAFPHTLLSGPPGLGKTTLAAIIAEEQGVEFEAVLATAITDEDQLEHLLNQLPKDGYDAHGNIVSPELLRPKILFVDEIHRLKKSITEALHTVLEDGKVTLKRKNKLTGLVEAHTFWVPRFCLIGATNYLGSLPKPFLDRFQHQFIFETYEPHEIVEVLEGSAKRLEIEVTPEALEGIANRSRGVPRIANCFLERCRDLALALEDEFGQKITVACVEQLFRLQEIDELGLTRLDRKVLDYLWKIGGPVGLDSVAHAVDEDRRTLANVVEPWLLRLRLLAKTGSGRIITQRGVSHVVSHALQER